MDFTSIDVHLKIRLAPDGCQNTTCVFPDRSKMKARSSRVRSCRVLDVFTRLQLESTRLVDQQNMFLVAAPESLDLFRAEEPRRGGPPPSGASPPGCPRCEDGPSIAASSPLSEIGQSQAAETLQMYSYMSGCMPMVAALGAT